MQWLKAKFLQVAWHNQYQVLQVLRLVYIGSNESRGDVWWQEWSKWYALHANTLPSVKHGNAVQRDAIYGQVFLMSWRLAGASSLFFMQTALSGSLKGCVNSLLNPNTSRSMHSEPLQENTPWYDHHAHPCMRTEAVNRDNVSTGMVFEVEDVWLLVCHSHVGKDKFNGRVIGAMTREHSEEEWSGGGRDGYGTPEELPLRINLLRPYEWMNVKPRFQTILTCDVPTSRTKLMNSAMYVRFKINIPMMNK